MAAAAGRSPLRYHVTVQVVPREACPGAALHRTTAVTHCPASFYETFELSVMLYIEIHIADGHSEHYHVTIFYTPKMSFHA